MENNNTKNGKKKKEGINNSVRIRTRHLRLEATTLNHYTTETGYAVFRKKSFILFLLHETSAGKMIASRINRAINSEKTM